MNKTQSGRYSFGFLRQGQNKQLIVKQCISIIEQLQLELQRISKINEEQNYLIQILKEGKQYYQKQCKLNTFQQQYLQIQKQNQHMQMLLEIHKKTEEQLNKKLNKFYEQKQFLLTAIKEKDQKNHQQEQKYLKLLLQKQMVQKEWNKVIRAVKKKISILVANNQINPQNNPKKQFIGVEKSNQKKQRMDVIIQEANDFSKEIPLQKRAQNMVKLIDNILAAQQLENMLTGDSSNKKTDPKNKQIQQNKVLRQIDLNRLEAPFNLEFY